MSYLRILSNEGPSQATYELYIIIVLWWLKHCFYILNNPYIFIKC